MTAMKQKLLLALALTPYVKGRVMVKYRSMDMVHRLRIEAVQQVTSKETHMLQAKCPSPQEEATSTYMASGMTRRATQRSDPIQNKNHH
jgi:hypothetical protein